MKWNCRLRGLTLFVFNFGVESLELSVKLVRFPWQLPSLNATFFQTDNQKAVLFTVFSSLELFFSCCTVLRWRKKTYFKRRPLFCSQIFSVSKCCDIQGSHLIGYLRISLIIDQSELTLLCAELPERFSYFNQSELSNFFMYIIRLKLYLWLQNRTSAQREFHLKSQV